MEQRNSSDVVSKFFKKEDIEFLKKLNERTENLKDLLNDSHDFGESQFTSEDNIKKRKVK